MKYSVLFSVGMVCAVAATAPSAAKEPTKQDRWAQCLWQNVPTSAANWLAISPTISGDSRKKTPSELLEYRLQAACFEQLKPEGKKYPISFNVTKIRVALATSKPESVGTDIVDPKAYQCVRFFLSDTEMKNPAAFKWGFGDFDAGFAFSSVSYIFAAEGGGGVGLPNTGGLRKCQWINSEGALIDA